MAKRRMLPSSRRPYTELREALVVLLLERDGSTCGFCGKRLDVSSASIDHVVPVTMGGVHRIENFRLLHRSCQQGAYVQAMRERGYCRVRRWTPWSVGARNKCKAM